MKQCQLLLALICLIPAHAEQNSYFSTSAEYACIMDAETGLILYSKNSDAHMIPASMTKIMSAFILFEHIKNGKISLDQKFPVSTNAYQLGGSASGSSTSFLEPDSLVSIENLLRGMIVQSGNDAAIALAEAVSGSEAAFAYTMTQRARELGLKSASFTNASGLHHPNHYISPSDLAELTRLMIQRFPELYKMFGEESFQWNNISQRNRNPLLGKFPGADGVKTGHLSLSGFGIVASAVSGAKRRIIVLNGLRGRQAREEETRRVMRAALEDFRIRNLVEAGNIVGQAEIYLGTQTKLPLVVQKNAVAGMHLKAIQKIQAEIVYPGPLIAPVKAGQIIGKLVIHAPGTKEITVPVAAATDIPRLNLLARAILGLTGAR